MTQPADSRRPSTIRFSHDEGHFDQEFNPPNLPPTSTLQDRYTEPTEPPRSHQRYSLPDTLPAQIPRPLVNNVSPNLPAPISVGTGGLRRTSRVNPPSYHNRNSSDLSSASSDIYTQRSSPLQQQQHPPLKPALRRSSTEEHLRHLAARQAIDIVQTHTRGLDSDRRAARDEESGRDYEDDRDQPRGTGVLSNLLKLYGGERGNGSGGGGLKRSASMGTQSSWGTSVAPSRTGSLDEREKGVGFGSGRRPGLKKSYSEASLATSLNEYVLDDDDPRLRDKDSSSEKEKDGGGISYMRKARSYSDEGHPEKIGKRFRNDEKELEKERKVYEAMKGKFDKLDKDNKKKWKKGKKHRALAITAHVADIIQRQDFILKLAKALMTFGAPSHRLESQLNATAKVLDVDAQFIHIPSVVIASFGDPDTHTSETKFVKASGGLNLGSLHEVHGIYRAVVHDELGVEEGTVGLAKLLGAKPIYNLWQRMIIAAMCAGIIAPLGFGGSFVDAFVSGAFGATLAFLQLYAAQKNAIFSNIFEISIAALISFIARGLSTTNYFCYEALSSAGVVLVLPGYVILCGSLELASKNLVAGSVRMVYAIIYTLFLGFSIAVGSDLFYLFDPAARHAQATVQVATTTLTGTFAADNTTSSFTGAFSFTNQTVAGGVNSAQASLQKGNIMCYRDPSWEWWRQSAGLYWLILLVPAFSFFLSLWNMQPLRSKELPVMIIIAVIGFITNRLATEYIFDRSDIVSFIGATVIGLLGNMYSRVFKGTSFTAMATGVLFLVPSGVAAAGGLAMTNSSGGDSYNSGLMIGFRMVQVAIGITIGLFFSSFIIYSIGSKKKGGGLGFAF